MHLDHAERPLPMLIQGGMGVGVSGWRLARAVAVTGQLGAVSGTAIDTVHARVLGDGDPDGHLRRAYAASNGCWIVGSSKAVALLARSTATFPSAASIPRPHCAS